MYFNIEVVVMEYFIELPFRGRPSDDVSQLLAEAISSELVATMVSDDLLVARGVTFMRISGRQFDRITKSYRQMGCSYQVTGVVESFDQDYTEVSKTLLLKGNPAFPAMNYPTHEQTPSG